MSAVIVLGMHFSGTSCLSEALLHAGVEFGTHLRVGSDYSTYEDGRISLLHVRSMAWDNPCVFVPTPAAQEECSRIVSSYEGRDFGFKEPSSMFFTELWEKFVQARYVGTFRHPGPVKAHIKRHWGKTTVQTDDLWMRYANRLLELHSEHRFPLVCFDDEAELYRASLERAVRHVCDSGVEIRFDPALRESYPHEPASSGALALYDKLKAAQSKNL
jgi:hypothetical protein